MNFADILAAIAQLALPYRLLIFAGLAVSTHLVVIAIRKVTASFLRSQPARRYQKLRSVTTLSTSVIVFTLYFLAIGLILHEFGVSLTAYLASASVAGLAIGFGSQGIVQDVVTGLTLIFSDLIDVGDLVDISGQNGVVKAITMRFVELENALGASVFIPNRTINNITNYPRGYVRCLVDVTLCGDEQARLAAIQSASSLMHDSHEQFAGLLIVEPSVEGRLKLHSGKEILRIKFRIWPNSGGPIETTFRQELLAQIQATDPSYQAWMIAVSYEAEKKRLYPKQSGAMRPGG